MQMRLGEKFLHLVSGDFPMPFDSGVDIVISSSFGYFAAQKTIAYEYLHKLFYHPFMPFSVIQVVFYIVYKPVSVYFRIGDILKSYVRHRIGSEI